MSRYISMSEALAALKMGRAVEQLLKVWREDGDRLVQWIRIHKERPGEYCLSVLKAFDQGNKNFHDLVEFQSFDPDEPFGEMVCFSDPQHALAYAVDRLNASESKFVNSGMAQSEYDDYVAQHGFADGS
jgi:hypothetical protein